MLKLNKSKKKINKPKKKINKSKKKIKYLSKNFNVKNVSKKLNEYYK
jgi:hypothetical protein